MTDKGNALDRIMSKRTRPAVPARDDIVNESIAQDAKTSLSQDIKTGVGHDSKKNFSLEMPKVVRSTTRLEESIDTALRHLCADEKLTKEVWFEAAFLYLSNQPEAMAAVNEIASERLRQRKQAADLRRAQTMKDKLENRLSL